jgi:hypothetical protein
LYGFRAPTIRKHPKAPRTVLDDGGTFQFVGPDKLIAFHCHGDFKLRDFLNRGLHAAQDFSEASNSNRRIAVGKSDKVFNSSAHFHLSGREETDAARTDIARSLCAVYPLIAQLDDLKR